MVFSNLISSESATLLLRVTGHDALLSVDHQLYRILQQIKHNKNKFLVTVAFFHPLLTASANAMQQQSER